jgi:threonyl-tRNA synthetase
LRKAGFRVDIDERNEKVGYKIREAEVQKIPVMAIIGEKERDSRMVAVRRHGKGDQGSMTIEALQKLLSELIDSKSQ